MIKFILRFSKTLPAILTVIILSTLLVPPVMAAGYNTTTGSLELVPTFECIGVYANFSNDDNGNGVPDECEDQPCPGDLDGDGFRNVTDFTLFTAAYGSEVGDPNYDPAADLNGDGFVNVTDFTEFAAVYGTACP